MIKVFPEPQVTTKAIYLVSSELNEKRTISCLLEISIINTALSRKSYVIHKISTPPVRKNNKRGRKEVAVNCISIARDWGGNGQRKGEG